MVQLHEKHVADKTPGKKPEGHTYTSTQCPLVSSRHLPNLASATIKLKCQVDTREADESDHSIEIIMETLLPPPRLPDAPSLASDFQHCSRRHATITQLWGNGYRRTALCSYIHTYLR